MQTKTLCLGAIAVLSVSALSLTLTATPALAQGPAARTNVTSLDFQQTDVRDALRQLFQIVGVSYTIAPDVQGTVTLSLRNVPFETVLHSLTRQVDATYRVEGGVYAIVRGSSPPITPPITFGSDFGDNRLAPSAQGRLAPAITVDGKFLFVVTDLTVFKVDKTTMKVVGKTTLQ